MALVLQISLAKTFEEAQAKVVLQKFMAIGNMTLYTSLADQVKDQFGVHSVMKK